MSMNSPQEEASSHVHDVIIIGAGPCGLAVAARLCEHVPDAVFTDDDHRRIHWLRRHSGQTSIKNRRNGVVDPPRAASRHSRKYDTLVLDATGDEWMTRWNRLFKTFDITHLRSPMFFHVDPGDRDGLLAYTHEQRREKDLEEIMDCVGKETSKHHKKKQRKTRNAKPSAELVVDERDRKDYFTPSSSLFSEYCECVVGRYGLRKGLVRQETVQDINYDYVDGVSDILKVFSLRTDRTIRYARTVVLAIGPGNAPAIPGLKATDSVDGACHSMQIKQFPDPSVVAKIKANRRTNVLVVGGGLTSAQIADLAIRRGVTKVWLLVRGHLKVKPFDVDLDWMAKFRNLKQAVFWSADSDEERLEQIKTARNGGSITPRFRRITEQHISRGTVSLHTHTTIVSRVHDAAAHSWTVSTDPPIPNLPQIDYIYFATGIQTDFTTLPLLRTIKESFPIQGCGGLPCLNEDMMWKDDVPLFVTGRLASLRLGPGAGNLAGARVGAERVVWGIEDVLKDEGKQEDANGHSHEEDEGYKYFSGTGSRYQSLVCEGEDDD